MRKGFTLLELLIVVIIVGILAAIAVPQFFKVAERARATELVNILGAVRSAQMRYYSLHTSFATTIADLDLDVPTYGKYYDLFTAQGPAYADAAVISGIQRSMTQYPGSDPYVLNIQVDGQINCYDTTDPNMCRQLGF